MKYYSEEEVKRIINTHTSLNAEALIVLMKPSVDPSSDRERIRMELWKDAYLQASKYDKYTAEIYSIDANDALAAFDKQFPK